MEINARNQDEIVVYQQDTEDVDEFTYLVVCQEGGGTKVVKWKRGVRQTTWDLEFCSISKKKVESYSKTHVVSVLLYECET